MKREQKDYHDLGRGLWQNHLRTEESKLKSKDSGKPDAYYHFKMLVNGNIWLWARHYLRSRFGAKHNYQCYPEFGDKGIYKMRASAKDGTVKLCMTADWASDTEESDQIGFLMQSKEPDYTFHLGDTYFVGTKDEISRNFGYKQSSWPRGKWGSFALLGNHEMYSRGIPYFRDLLPTMGVYSEDLGYYIGQKCSYLCLENNYWRLIGIDTGYNSVGLPVIERFIEPDCELEPELLEWLDKNLNIKDDKRGIIFMSHHPYYSGFEEWYQKPAEQLAKIIGRERKVLWFWGHEHRFAIYGRYRTRKGVNAYGRCIGNGGMPQELDDKPLIPKDARKSNLVLYDNRQNCDIEDCSTGFNGYTYLEIKDDLVKMKYYDIKDTLLLEEVWQSDVASGEIKGIEITDHNSGLSYFGGRKLNNAIE
jgi:hypothetical protein